MRQKHNAAFAGWRLPVENSNVSKLGCVGKPQTKTAMAALLVQLKNCLVTLVACSPPPKGASMRSHSMQTEGPHG